MLRYRNIVDKKIYKDLDAVIRDCVGELLPASQAVELALTNGAEIRPSELRRIKRSIDAAINKWHGMIMEVEL
jgi:hypothetical protein